MGYGHATRQLYVFSCSSIQGHKVRAPSALGVVLFIVQGFDGCRWCCSRVVVVVERSIQNGLPTPARTLHLTHSRRLHISPLNRDLINVAISWGTKPVRYGQESCVAADAERSRTMPRICLMTGRNGQFDRFKARYGARHAANSCYQGEVTCRAVPWI